MGFFELPSTTKARALFQLPFQLHRLRIHPHVRGRSTPPPPGRPCVRPVAEAWRGSAAAAVPADAAGGPKGCSAAAEVGRWVQGSSVRNPLGIWESFWTCPFSLAFAVDIFKKAGLRPRSGPSHSPTCMCDFDENHHVIISSYPLHPNAAFGSRLLLEKRTNSVVHARDDRRCEPQCHT